MNRKTVLRIIPFIWVGGCLCLSYAGYCENGLGGALLGALVAGVFAIPIFAIGFTYKLDQERWDMLYWQDCTQLEERYGPVLKKVWVDVKSSQGNFLWWSGSGKQELNICRDVFFINNAEGGCFCVHYSQHPIHKRDKFFKSVLIVEDILVPEATLRKIYRTMYINNKRKAKLLLGFNRSEEADFVMSVAQQAKATNNL